ncbi:hypothetical protein M9458_033447, partial [Cirrhinus mrigala]
MPRRFCRACKAPLYAADNHGECVSCLGLPHAEVALKETECPHCGDMSLSSLRLRIVFFSERDSAPRALPFPPSQEPVKKKQRGRGSQRSESGELTSAQPPRASPSPQREGFPVLFTCPDLDLVSFGGSEDDMLDSMSLAASDAKELSGSVNDPAPLPSTDTSDPRTKTGMDAELFRVLTRAVDELGLEWSPPEEPPHSLLDEWFLPGTRQAPRQRASPFLPEVHEELTRSWRAPYSACLRTSSSSALTSVDGAEDKGYEKLPPLDKSVAAHLCPPTAIGWKTKASHPSKPCRTTSALAGRAYTSAGQAASALHSMAILQVFQAKLLAQSDRSALDPATLTELRSATDLALRATKATAQAIGRSMASLVVLERHLWLTLTEIKDTDKVPFLDAPISPTGLFGPSVEGFTERFSAAQKTSQAMAASGRPKPTPPQQPVRPASTAPSATAAAAQPAKAEPRLRSRSARRYPFPKRQGPRPKLALDPAPPPRGLSLALAGPPPKRPLLNLQALRSMPGAELPEPIRPGRLSLECQIGPPRFSGVVPTVVKSRDAHVLRSEVLILLEKGAIEVVHPAQSESGFYSRYFLVPKKDGGLRPILDLRHLNQALMKRPFKMLTLKQILSHVRPGDWFLSLDLKDAYFHIQIAPHHRRFLRFAFEGVAYQYTVLPFALSLAPRTFTKCMDAALLPLRQKGIRILNYLDDWLVLAQSEAELHLECLGLRVNLSKSVLHPSRQVSFLGAIFDSTQASTGNRATSGLIQGRSPLPSQEVSKDARPYGFRVPSARTGPAAYAAPSALVETTGSTSCMASRTPVWKPWSPGKAHNGSRGARKAVTTDASNKGWGALCDGNPAFGLWSKAEEGFHINCLETSSMSRPLRLPARPEGTPCTDLLGQHDCGVLHKSHLFTLVKGLLEWAQLNLASLRAVHVPGRLNQGADLLSRSNVPSGEKSGRSLARQRQLSLPNILFEGQRCVGPRLAQPPPVCFSPDILDSSGTQASQGTTSQAPPGGPSLEDPAVVFRTVPAALCSPLADPPEAGPPLSGERDHMAPPAQSVGLTPLVLGRESENLPEGVLNTISQARAPSTRRLYALKWSVFSTWCSTRGKNPAFCDISVILSFLQELLDKGRSPSTLKVYVAAIAAFHAPIADQSIGRNNLV